EWRETHDRLSETFRTLGPRVQGADRFRQARAFEDHPHGIHNFTALWRLLAPGTSSGRRRIAGRRRNLLHQYGAMADGTRAGRGTGVFLDRRSRAIQRSRGQYVVPTEVSRRSLSPGFIELHGSQGLVPASAWRKRLGGA